MKIRKNGCALKQLKEKKDKYIVQKKTRKIKMNFILSGAISNCPSAHLLVGATNFDLFFFSHNNNKEIWVAKTDAWKNMIVANCALKWRRESLLKQVMKWNETFVKKLAVKPWVLTVLVKYVEILYAVWHRVYLYSLCLHVSFLLFLLSIKVWGMCVWNLISKTFF